ncbi:hypothetical protein BGZ83_006927 [Gryganskiella cystojenkinii]|nr:hypothetical protein BGZ83_006927 [Gryganskiella cystojenkinii]
MYRLEKRIPALHPVKRSHSFHLEKSWVQYRPTPPRKVLEDLQSKTQLDLQVIYYWFQCRLYLGHIESILDLADFDGTVIHFPDLANFHELMLFSVVESPYCQQVFPNKSNIQQELVKVKPLIPKPSSSVSEDEVRSLSTLPNGKNSAPKGSNETRDQIDTLYPPLVPRLLPTSTEGPSTQNEDDDDFLGIFKPDSKSTPQQAATTLSGSESTASLTGTTLQDSSSERSSVGEQCYDVIEGLAIGWQTRDAQSTSSDTGQSDTDNTQRDHDQTRNRSALESCTRLLDANNSIKKAST